MAIIIYFTKYKVEVFKLFILAFVSAIMITFFLTLVIDVVLLIMTYRYIIVVGKAAESTENSRFKLERER